jgi:predicted RNA-binding Zn ribbon-like protein
MDSRKGLELNGHLVRVAPRRDLCLDFVNTIAWRGSTREDSLGDVSDLMRWCENQGLLGDVSRLTRWMGEAPAGATALFAEAIELRECLNRIFLELPLGRSAPEADLKKLNAVLVDAPPRNYLTNSDHDFGWQIAHDRLTAASLLAPVWWSAGDLLVTGEIGRLRHCANPRCLWLFFDDSKNGSRRWCSMQACGNRAKAHRHYLRHRAMQR